MKLELWYIGKSKFSFIDEGIKTFKKRISRYHSLELIELPNIKSRKNKSSMQIRKEEASLIESRLKIDNLLILLDERGNRMDSLKFADFLKNKLSERHSKVIFLVGGAYGFNESIRHRSNSSISLSDMTFSHQLIKLIFIEQLYRAFTILNNHPYHNE